MNQWLTGEMRDDRATGIEPPFRWSALPPRLQLAFVILATGDLNTRCRPNGLAPLFRNVSEAKFARAQRSRIAVSSPETPSTVHITICAERLESSAETQPQLQPALLRLSAMIFKFFTRRMTPKIAPIVVRISVNSEDCCYLSLITIHCSLQSSGRLAQW